MKYLRRTAVNLLCLSLLMVWGCSSVNNVSKKFGVYGKTYEVVSPLFVYQSADEARYGLEAPGVGPHVPPDVLTYKQHPQDWMKTPQYAATYGSNELYGHAEVVGVLEAGTLLKVERVLAVHTSPLGTIYVPLVRVTDSAYANRDISAVFVFDQRAGSEPVLVAKSKYLKEVASS